MDDGRFDQTGTFAVPERDQSLEDGAACVECGHAGGGRYWLWAAERWRMLGASCTECGARIPRGLVAALSDPEVRRTVRELGRGAASAPVATHQVALVTGDARFPGGSMVLRRGSLAECEAEAAQLRATASSMPIVEPADGRELVRELLARLRWETA